MTGTPVRSAIPRAVTDRRRLREIGVPEWANPVWNRR